MAISLKPVRRPNASGMREVGWNYKGQKKTYVMNRKKYVDAEKDTSPFPPFYSNHKFYTGIWVNAAGNWLPQFIDMKSGGVYPGRSKCPTVFSRALSVKIFEKCEMEAKAKNQNLQAVEPLMEVEHEEAVMVEEVVAQGVDLELVGALEKVDVALVDESLCMKVNEDQEMLGDSGAGVFEAKEDQRQMVVVDQGNSENNKCKMSMLEELNVRKKRIEDEASMLREDLETMKIVLKERDIFLKEENAKEDELRQYELAQKERAKKDLEDNAKYEEQLCFRLLKIMEEGKKKDMAANRSQEESEKRQERRSKFFLLQEILKGHGDHMQDFDSGVSSEQSSLFGTDSMDSGVREYSFEEEVSGEGIYVEPLNVAYPSSPWNSVASESNWSSPRSGSNWGSPQKSKGVNQEQSTKSSQKASKSEGVSQKGNKGKGVMSSRAKAGPMQDVRDKRCQAKAGLRRGKSSSYEDEVISVSFDSSSSLPSSKYDKKLKHVKPMESHMKEVSSSTPGTKRKRTLRSAKRPAKGH